jgi:nucleotide-binding universal stress UspA family protein
VSDKAEEIHEEKDKHKAGGPILVPVDFSEHSEAALVLATELAQGLGAPLMVLHVVHDPGNMPGYYARVAKKRVLARLDDLAGEMLDAFLEKAKARHPELKGLGKAERLLVSGLPVTRILQVAAKKRARLIVLGSKGATGLKHLLLGSVAEQVLHLAEVPVTIVRHPTER